MSSKDSSRWLPVIGSTIRVDVLGRCNCVSRFYGTWLFLGRLLIVATLLFLLLLGSLVPVTFLEPGKDSLDSCLVELQPYRRQLVHHPWLKERHVSKSLEMLTVKSHECPQERSLIRKRYIVDTRIRPTASDITMVLRAPDRDLSQLGRAPVILSPLPQGNMSEVTIIAEQVRAEPCLWVENKPPRQSRHTQRTNSTYLDGHRVIHFRAPFIPLRRGVYRNERRSHYDM